ncbi:hypothetical protein VUR80DRAFT_9454 [Thermomyces stellatus]
MTVGDPASTSGSNPGLRHTCFQDVITCSSFHKAVTGPFVWSYGAQVGHARTGAHLFGRKEDALQRAMGDPSLLSGQLPTQSVAEANACSVESSVEEEIDGCEFPFAPHPLSHFVDISVL